MFDVLQLHQMLVQEARPSGAEQTGIAKVLREYLEGESIPQPIRAAEQNLRLRLASEEYPFLYYRLTYLEYANDVIVYTTDEQGNEIETNYGKYFIFNRDDGRFVPVGDTVHKYVE